MRVTFNVKGYIDRRTPELIVRGDSITEKLYRWRVSRNLKERQRQERTERRPIFLLQQAG